MSKLFEHFHLSMIERDQQDMYIEPMTREVWLRHILSQRIEFRHKGNDMFWVPKEWSPDLITAIVERKRQKTQHHSPDEGAEEFTGEEWQGSIVIVDPAHHPDGQKLAFEHDAAVGQPSAILATLVAHINLNPANQYALHFKALIAEGSFARFAEKHGGILNWVSFKFTVPNMIFGASTKTTDGLKRVGKDTGAQEVEVKLESDDGVKTGSETVEEAVAYAEAGNAQITAKSRNGEFWSSTKRRVTVKMQSILDFSSEKRDTVSEWLNEALNRGKNNSDARIDSADDPTDVG